MGTHAKVTISDVRHVHVCGDRKHYCGHPRQHGLWNFGGGELVLVHGHATWDYEKAYPKHGWGENGYKKNSVVLLQRSTDGGETWPEADNVVVYDETTPVEERKAFVSQKDVPRDEIDLSDPNAMVVFIRTWLGEKRDDSRALTTTFALRSADRGRTWESAPTVIGPAAYWRALHDTHGFPTIAMPDGSRVVAMTTHPSGALSVYGTDDDGLTWTFLAEVARSGIDVGSMDYPGIIRLPSGRVLVTMLDMFGKSNAICICESDDLYNWTEPRRICRWGASPWRKHLKPGQHARSGGFPGNVHYRSPWPLLLRDGRILVVFARRYPPCGMGGLISEDEGRTWSDEFIIRCDASGTDLGYPLVTQLDDGRVFTAYYYMVADGNLHGGTRHIAGSFFTI